MESEDYFAAQLLDLSSGKWYNITEQKRMHTLHVQTQMHLALVCCLLPA
jgi:hypothetical protein